MAVEVPAKLKSVDITRFSHRAAQLETIKPTVAYWCYYWIINQVLTSGLHNADAECTSFSNSMMDKLEQMKEKFVGEPSIADDKAGQAYIEQFGNETFQRADNAMAANRVSRQTADTFQAAATFLELHQIWSPLGPDVSSKIKYAKFHALRIAKAIKAGEDPNTTNPVQKPDPSLDEDAIDQQATAVVLDPEDPEVQQITGAGKRQPSVEETPDDHDRIRRSLAAQSALDQSLHPSRASSIPRTRPDGVEGAVNGKPEATNAESDSGVTSSNPRAGSVGGGYFPVPSPADANSPEAPPFVDTPPVVGLTSTVPPTASTPENFYSQAPSSHVPSHPDASSGPQPSQPPRAGQITTPAPSQLARPAAPTPITAATAQQQPLQQNPNMEADDVAVAEAQKHARWAISALNFEDVGTAVKELRLALTSLGGG